MFSIKSAYKFFVIYSNDTYCSFDSLLIAWWKTLWSSNKIKVFMWRLCHDILPTNFNLYLKKVQNSCLCVMCKREKETIDHVFFYCKQAKKVWKMLLPTLNFNDVGLLSLVDWFLILFSMISIFYIEILPISF